MSDQTMNEQGLAPLNFDSIDVGDKLPGLVFGPISRHTLALFCGGSGDHNPIHVDSDFAKESGYDDVFVHGMLPMAILGRLLTNWTRQENIKTFAVRFMSITQIRDEVNASAIVKEKVSAGGENRLILDVETHTQSGTKTLSGTAEICVPDVLVESNK